MTIGELAGLIYGKTLRIDEYNKRLDFLRSYTFDLNESGDIPFDLCERKVDGIEAYENTLVIDITEV